MGIQLYANNSVTTLADALTDSGTSLVVESGATFPASLTNGDWFIGTLQHIVSGVVTAFEIVMVTAVSGTAPATYTIVRAQESTSAQAWAVGDTFTLLPTAGGMGLFVQGSSGSFTGTLTGFSGEAPTDTFYYSVAGNLVSLFCYDELIGSSNSDAMTLTGLPEAIIPSEAIQLSGLILVINDGVTQVGGVAIGDDGSLEFYAASVSGSSLQMNAAGFSSSGTKGLASQTQIIYTLDTPA